MSQPFHRFNTMMSLIVAAMGRGLSQFDAQKAVGTYKSRGKGKGVPGKNYFNRRSGRPSPCSTARQDARAAKKYYMATVNGFEIMQTRSSKEIAELGQLKLAA